MYLNISLSIVLLHTCVQVTTGVCDAGWFGSSCQFKCRCTNNKCDVDGKCTGGSTCVKGWFGHLCQYSDLATVQTGIKTSNKILTDGDDKTCASVTTFTVSWDIAYDVSWIRVVFYKPESIENPQVSFVKENGESIPCNGMRLFTFSLKVTEILCQSSVLIKAVLLDFKSNKTACSVHISGGRNVAIKQSTEQSSTWRENDVSYDSSRAVDGNPSGIFFTHKSCAHTISRVAGIWKVTLSQPWNPNRYVIYNRGDNRQRIKGFVLRSNSSTNRQEFIYTDQSPNNNTLIYNITTRPSATPITIVTISVPDMLTLCEVEIYSDHYCTPNAYGPECSITCNCKDRNEKCFATTGGCPSGCPEGYEGYGCSEPCSESYHGAGCIERCSRLCFNQQCNNVDGSCRGCSAGYKGVFCDHACDITYYGTNCTQRCSTNCTKQHCGNTNGTCNTCVIGKQGSFCEKNCSATAYGDHCSKPCSTNCIDRLCDNVNGRCLSCKSGKIGVLCDQDCADGQYGVNCASTCSDRCLNSQCDKTNGHCLKCKPGYRGHFCDQDCDVGYYGDGCHTACSSLCVVNATQVWCNYRDGTCLLGCNGTFTVQDTECSLFNDTAAALSSETEDYPIDQSDSTIFIIGAMLIVIGFIIIFILFRPRKVTESNITGSEQPVANRNTNCNMDVNDMEFLVSELHGMQTDESLFDFGEFNGYKSKERCIASPGPNEISDCVRMLGEQHLHFDTRVLLDIMNKEGKKKRSLYRPTEGSLKCGDIKVKLAKTHVFADYTLRKLELSKKDQPTQFHYTSWPVKGVPLTPWGLVDFEQRLALVNISWPISVRYSASVYRNVNDFNALCNLLREADDTGRINWLQIVAELREQCVLVMLTAEQYQFLHKAAQVAIVCMGTTVSSEDIVDRIQKLSEFSLMKRSVSEEDLMEQYRCLYKVLEKHKEVNTPCNNFAF